MSEEEMKALVEMNNMLKAKLEQQTKVYQQSLQEMQREIDDLQRNCDVFNEQMNDAVERATELQIENNKLKQQLQAYKDKYSDLETDYAKAVENEKTLTYTCNKYYDELQVYKDKEDKIRECCMPLITLNNIDCCKECGSTNIKQNYKPYKIAEDILQILNEGDK